MGFRKPFRDNFGKHDHENRIHDERDLHPPFGKICHRRFKDLHDRQNDQGVHDQLTKDLFEGFREKGF